METTVFQHEEDNTSTFVVSKRYIFLIQNPLFFVFFELNNFFYINNISKKLKRYYTENHVFYIVFKFAF